MQKLTMRKSLAWLLLVICIQWLLPRELWHEFTNHQDTDDHQVVGNARINFSEQHEHCLILELSLPPVVHEDAQEVNFEQAYNRDFFIAENPAPVTIFITFDHARGPPSVKS